MGDVSGKIAFITGASSGIGKGCAELFASQGVNLILAARRIERLDTLSEELSKKHNIEVLTRGLDVCRQPDVESTVTNLPEKWKDIDILISSAGIGRDSDTFHDGSISDWDEIIDTNLKGLLYVSRAIVPLMVKRNAGHIAIIGSTAAHSVVPGSLVYCATKWGMNALAKGFKLDLTGTNIRVTIVHAGRTETEFRLVMHRGDAERAKKHYEGVVPLSSKDVAESVLFAVSQPSHVNIAEIIVTPTDYEQYRSKALAPNQDK